MEEAILSSALKAQQNELTEHTIYARIARKTKDEHNRKILERIAEDELRHYHFWKSLTKRELKPERRKVYLFMFLSAIFGLSFALKLMERGEELATEAYNRLSGQVPGLTPLIQDEQKHEKDLLDMLAEERLEYAGSMVLGLNDALVELTGALVGLTFALQNTRIVAIIGFISGIAAAMSMAASGYLSSKEEVSEAGGKSPFKSALYTGIAYIATVSLLILPYLLLTNIYFALAVMLTTCIFIIAGYTFYITTAKSQSFGKRFTEMALISLSVAAISFVIGWSVRNVFGVEL